MNPNDGQSASIEARLHAMERDQLELRARHNTLDRALCSLIATHPAPERFAAHFQQVTSRTFNAHLYDEKVSDAVRNLSQRLAQELVQLAQDETARRAGHAPRAD